MVAAADGAVPHRLSPGAVPIDAELSVVEQSDAFLVVVEDDPEDWLVRFDRADDFDARGWAENMARIYNQRRRRPDMDARFGARRPG